MKLKIVEVKDVLPTQPRQWCRTLSFAEGVMRQLTRGGTDLNPTGVVLLLTPQDGTCAFAVVEDVR